MNRIYNFSPGPATLPEKVLKKIQKEFLNYQKKGYSIIEISHRSNLVKKIFENCKKDFIALLDLKNQYDILFLHGGASAMFAQIPMNLFTSKNQVANYIETGTWVKKAIKEAKFFGKVNIAASSEKKNFSFIPKTKDLNIVKNALYTYICSNNTIFGTQWHQFPKVKSPLIGDFSSDILSRKVKMSSFDIFFAGAQKNLGPAGVAILGIKKNILSKCREDIPSMYSYKVASKNQSCFNTPPVFAIYVMSYVLEWIKDLGGIKKIEEQNKQKSQAIYDTLDQYSHIYHPTANKEDRSMMNITFTLPNKTLTSVFLKKAEQANFLGLKGHRSVGGIRASIYNAFPKQGIEEFTKFLKKFAKKN